MCAVTKINSIYCQFIKLLLSAAIIAGVIFISVNTLSNSLLEEYYPQSEYRKKKDEKYLEKLQAYITYYDISSKDVYMLKNWVKTQKILSLQIFNNGKMIFDSDYPDVEMWEESIESSEYEWITYYSIEFKDGISKVGLIGWYEYQLYNYMLITEIVFSFLLYIILILLGIRKKMTYISKLCEEIGILEGGGLDYHITIEGEDELAALAKGLESMRISILNMIEKESEMVNENRRIITEMSHDLRTPVTSVLLYTELLKNKKYENEKQFSDYLNKVVEKAHCMKQLTDHLFEYSLISGEKRIELENEEYCRVLFYDLFSETCNYLMQKGFDVEFEMEWPDKKLSIYTEYVVRIIDNITSNIIKYADVKQKIRIYSMHTKEMMGITFENHICGLKDKQESTEIGLHSIQNMMQKMNGNSQVTQKEGVFRIELYLPYTDKI